MVQSSISSYTQTTTQKVSFLTLIKRETVNMV